MSVMMMMMNMSVMMALMTMRKGSAEDRFQPGDEDDNEPNDLHFCHYRRCSYRRRHYHRCRHYTHVHHNNYHTHAHHHHHYHTHVHHHHPHHTHTHAHHHHHHTHVHHHHHHTQAQTHAHHRHRHVTLLENGWLKKRIKYFAAGLKKRFRFALPRKQNGARRSSVPTKTKTAKNSISPPVLTALRGLLQHKG